MQPSNTSSPDPRPKNYLGSTLLFIGIFSTATLTGLILLTIGLVLPFSWRWHIARSWCGVVCWMSGVFCNLHYRIEGLEHLDLKQPAIIFSNHQSAWETVAFRYLLPRHSVVLKRELLYFPVWGWALVLLKSIVINRKNQRAALKAIHEQGSTYLKEGLWVLIFPEGTRAPSGQMLKFNAGGAMLAQRTGVPVIPVAHNAGIFWPRYSFFKYPGVITVKIGPAISTQGRKAADINTEAEAWIKQALLSMS